MQQNESLTAPTKELCLPNWRDNSVFQSENKLGPSKRASKTNLKYHTLQPSFAHTECDKDIHTGCLLLSQKQIGFSNSKWAKQPFTAEKPETLTRRVFGTTDRTTLWCIRLLSLWAHSIPPKAENANHLYCPNTITSPTILSNGFICAMAYKEIRVRCLIITVWLSLSLSLSLSLPHTHTRL